jgi:hypothetical protein
VAHRTTTRKFYLLYERAIHCSACRATSFVEGPPDGVKFEFDFEVACVFPRFPPVPVVLAQLMDVFQTNASVAQRLLDFDPGLSKVRACMEALCKHCSNATLCAALIFRPGFGLFPEK